MQRSLAEEWLDHLEAERSEAIRSRQDLWRLNRLMGHPGHLTRVLRDAWPQTPGIIAELGTGDGRLMADVARRLGPGWAGTKVVLVDRQPVVSRATLEEFSRLGWSPEVVQADARDWLAAGKAWGVHAITANLFLHHFDTPQLRVLLSHAAGEARLFVALEPRRSVAALAASRLVGLIGCNKVTRHDAILSVRAGFTGNELSELWTTHGWELEERPAGCFSHLFIARWLDDA
jgi:hypothetical protein